MMVTYFRKIKQNIDEDKKEKFRMELVKKGLGLCRDSVCFVYLPSLFRTCAVKTVKLLINLFLLLVGTSVMLPKAVFSKILV